MNKLMPIEFKNQRIMTTEQLAEVYETDINNIQSNFKNHKDNFEEGKHYYLLQGEELKEFKSQLNNIQTPINKFTSSLYLWTERGANRHCKILDTDKAWEQFDNLEETYFRVKEVTPKLNNLSPQLQLLINMELKQNQLESSIEETKQEVQAMRDVMVLNSNSWRKDTATLINRMAMNAGGYEHIKPIREESYKLLEQRMGAQLSIRLTNKRRRMADEGICKSKRDKLNKIDVIADDKKLIEGYIAIVKEMAIKYKAA